MKRVDIFALARDAGRVVGRVHVSDLARLSQSVREPVGTIDFELGATQDRLGRPLGQLVLSGALSLTCDLCEAALEHSLHETCTYRFARSERELHGEPIDPEESSELLLGSVRFDVHELVEDEAILAIPISPRHASCQAAVEAKVAMADAEAPAADTRPFSVLAQLKTRRH
jgi:uncharacterized protein